MTTATAPSAPLTAIDRCDRCGAQAYVRVTLGGGGELLFCAHHAREHGEKLKEVAAAVHDETHKLSNTPAIATLFLSMVKPGDTIVHSGPLYAATETLIARILGRFGVHWLAFPAGATRAEIDAVLSRAATGNVALIYLESPANPTNALVDVEAVAASRDAIFANAAEKPPIAIDNTFLGPLWHQPLRHGADVVVYSLTKYAGGHSDLVSE